MDELFVSGPCSLRGEIKISQAKNACLPLMAAAILTEDEVCFPGLPELRDVFTMKKLLSHLGCEIGSESLTTKKLQSSEAPYELVKTMRASILVLGPLLARSGKARVSLPGGCAIGARPVDLHLFGMEKLGAKIRIDAGYVEASAEKLIGCLIKLPFPSVGATENILMAASLAEGVTTLENAAMEPEIEDLGNFLISMGAKITGHGSGTIRIEGVKKLSGTSYQPIGDRIEAATHIIGTLMTGGECRITGFLPKHLSALFDLLKKVGAKIELEENGCYISASNNLKSFSVETSPYPGFPTDIQAQIIALALVCEGESTITERIFENRFMHVPELIRMGASINLEGNKAVVQGKHPLTGAPVMCTDLRASAALVLAGMVAEGKTVVKRVYHLDRGYDRIEQKLSAVGANIIRKNG